MPFGQFWASIEDLISTRKSHNCAGIALIQGDSAGGSKLVEQTLLSQFDDVIGQHQIWKQFFQRLLSLGYVHTVPDSETERRRN